MIKKTIYAFGFAAVLGLIALNAHAMDADQVAEKKRTKLGLYLSAVEAHDFIEANTDTLFVDIRTRAEVNFLGMPTMADANIPYAEINTPWDWNDSKGSFKLDPNPQFLAAIEQRLKEKGLDRGANIVLMCRSGSRSAAAVNLLAEAGYQKVYTVVDGYEGDKAKEGPHSGQRVVNGWRNAGLAWSYTLDKGKMALN